MECPSQRTNCALVWRVSNTSLSLVNGMAHPGFHCSALLERVSLPRRFCRVFLTLMAAFFLALALAHGSAIAQPKSSNPDASQSPKVQLLLDLLGDQDVQTWVKEQRSVASVPKQTRQAASPGLMLADRLARVRQHIIKLAVAVPTVPVELARALQKLNASSGGYGFIVISAITACFLALGLVAGIVYRRLFVRQGSSGTTGVAISVGDMFWHLLKQMILALGSSVAFGLCSIGAFLWFDWPDLVRDIVVLLLISGLSAWAVWSVLVVLLTPDTTWTGSARSANRVIPLGNSEARHFLFCVTLAVGWFAIGYALVGIASLLGMDFSVRQVVAYVLGIGLLLIGFYTVLQRPVETTQTAVGTSFASMLLTGLVALWLLWAIGAMDLFWLLLVAFALPIAVKWAHLSVRNIFEHAQLDQSLDANGTVHGAQEEAIGNVWSTVVDHALRAILILGSITVLVWAWGIEWTALADNQDVVSRLIRSVLHIITIALIANLAWRIICALIDSSLTKMPNPADVGQKKEAIRQAKLLTLLPIIRNGAMVFILTLSVMMGLSALGIEIGPLIASAGIIGVAIGFGAQTLVKDVISGMFYLMDDAFRIGEYIIAGSYKGTVESFNLRSVKLRHHRGPIYTIPFGELGAVQNLSRDYVIDKLSFQVTYDTDLERARKLIKRAGQELASDPEIGPKIIEPLKMQRVENFGDYGIEIKTKLTCVPGGQWEVRKKIYPMIKQLFEENGIEFARPTVKVAGNDAVAAGAAAQAVKASQARRKTPAKKN